MIYSYCPSNVSRICGDASLFWFLVLIFYVFFLGQSDAVSLSILVNVSRTWKGISCGCWARCSINTAGWVWGTRLCCFVRVSCVPARLLFCYWERCVSSCSCGFVCSFLSVLSFVAVCILKLVITYVYIQEGYFFDEFTPLLLWIVFLYLVLYSLFEVRFMGY